MKLKSKLLLLTSMVGLSLQLNAAGTISGPGWYYQALPVGAAGTYANIFLKGAFPDKPTCLQTRQNDYNPDDGIKPWDGGPGCHYIYQNDVANANDLYSLVFNPGSDTIIGLPAEEMLEFFDQVDEINQTHDIKSYKAKMNQLIDSFNKPQR